MPTPQTLAERMGGDALLTLTITLPSELEAPRLARRSLEVFRERIGPDAGDNLRLLVSELITNSLLHAAPDGRIELTIELFPRIVRVSVVDSGPGFRPSNEVPPSDEPSGRGLYLVGLLADRWGVTRRGRTRVWFEMAVEAVREPSRAPIRVMRP